MNVEPYDPLKKVHLAENVAGALVAQAVVEFGKLKPIGGGGIYAIYYTGPFPAYAALVAADAAAPFTIPIYVGKAVPEGARTGGTEEVTSSLTGAAPVRRKRTLHERLSEHRNSIRKVTNLEVTDFHCRRLVVEPMWIALGEALMISRTFPVWNSLVSGFGNHDQGSGRDKQVRSRWDTIHPGRPAPLKLEARSETAEDIAADVVEYLRARLITSSSGTNGPIGALESPTMRSAP